MTSHNICQTKLYAYSVNRSPVQPNAHLFSQLMLGPNELERISQISSTIPECPERWTDSSAPTRMLSTARKSTLEAQDKAPSAGPRVGPSCIVAPTSSSIHRSPKATYVKQETQGNPLIDLPGVTVVLVAGLSQIVPDSSIDSELSVTTPEDPNQAMEALALTVISNVQHLNQGTCVTSPVTNEDIAFTTGKIDSSDIQALLRGISTDVVTRAPSICGSKSNAEEEGSRFQARMTSISQGSWKTSLNAIIDQGPIPSSYNPPRTPCLQLCPPRSLAQTDRFDR
ncbi:hypothetical protein C8J56DRAFT_1030677 [Mycena floridula]|nr:hypothetical protein C8J56DRAFT_1030677 [Mycena floridula]